MRMNNKQTKNRNCRLERCVSNLYKMKVEKEDEEKEGEERWKWEEARTRAVSGNKNRLEKARIEDNKDSGKKDDYLAQNVFPSSLIKFTKQ